MLLGRSLSLAGGALCYAVIGCGSLSRRRRHHHPSAYPALFFHAVCGLVLQLTPCLVGADKLVGWSQFWLLAQLSWFAVLALELFLALVNPWLRSTCKLALYHTLCWSCSLLSAALLSVYNIHHKNNQWTFTHFPMNTTSTNTTVSFLLLFGPILLISTASTLVLLIASIRFRRRQLDLTHRTKRRSLVQYLRYLLLFTLYWGSTAFFYYNPHTHKKYHLLALVIFHSYPFFLLLIWMININFFQLFKFKNNPATQATTTDYTVDQFTSALREDLMRYTSAGIIKSIFDIKKEEKELGHCKFSQEVSFSSPNPIAGRRSSLPLEENCEQEENQFIVSSYNEKKRLEMNIFTEESHYYEKYGVTAYAPHVFRHIRKICNISEESFKTSFDLSDSPLLEKASEGKSGMLFYFSTDQKYIVKTMTKQEHSFLLHILPAYHAYLLDNPRSLLCRFVGCYSMQLPFGWNKMFFVVMENVFATPANQNSSSSYFERFDLKGNNPLCASSPVPQKRRKIQKADGEKSILDPLLPKKESSRSHTIDLLKNEDEVVVEEKKSTKLFSDSDFIARGIRLNISSSVRMNLLAQMTRDCSFLQDLNILDYSCLLGILHRNAGEGQGQGDPPVDHAILSEDGQEIYYMGFIDMLQSYTCGWKCQSCFLSIFRNRQNITALPPSAYALRFLNFMNDRLLKNVSQRSRAATTATNEGQAFASTSSLFPLLETNQVPQHQLLKKLSLDKDRRRSYRSFDHNF